MVCSSAWSMLQGFNTEVSYIGVGSRGARGVVAPPRFFGLTESFESRSIE